jgi:hypothetical protein
MRARRTSSICVRASLQQFLLVSALCLQSGCGGGGGVSSSIQETFGISGTIKPSARASGANVTLSGAATATTMTANSGTYNFTGLANGNYAITPSNAGYSFNPTSEAVTINGANVTGVNFTATAAAPTYSIRALSPRLPAVRAQS